MGTDKILVVLFISLSCFSCYSWLFCIFNMVNGVGCHALGYHGREWISYFHEIPSPMMAVGMLVAETTSQHAHDGREKIFQNHKPFLRPSLAWHPPRHTHHGTIDKGLGSHDYRQPDMAKMLGDTHPRKN
jgi:hypothetical protein